jgi:hypothetical protein
LLHEVDVIVQGEAGRRKKLLVADMDSTMITIECIDELADYAGIKPQIAEITERAMRGELDFEARSTSASGCSRISTTWCSTAATPSASRSWAAPSRWCAR